MDEIQVGQMIVTADGEKVGKVRDISGTYFHVDAPLKPDFWLPFDAVRDPGENDDAISLVFTKDQLDDFKLDEPGL